MSDPEPRIAVSIVTSDNRGDHAADVTLALDPRPHETIAELVARARLDRPEDRLEVRILDDSRAVTPEPSAEDPWA